MFKTKTLGLIWSRQDSNLAYIIDIDMSNQKITKRMILSPVFKIFNPLGTLNQCSIPVKMFLQKVWSDRLSRDDPISDSMKIIWEDICQKNYLC